MPNSSTAVVRQLLSERTLDPALIQWLQRTEMKCPTTSFRNWKWMTGPSQRAPTRMRKQEGADDWQSLPESLNLQHLSLELWQLGLRGKRRSSKS